MKKTCYCIFVMFLCVSVNSFSMKKGEDTPPKPFEKLLPKTFEKKCNCTIILYEIDDFYGKKNEAIIKHRLFFGNVEIPTTTEISFVNNNNYTKVFSFECKELYNVFGAEAMEAQIPKKVEFGRARYNKPPCAVLLKVQLQFADGKDLTYYAEGSLLKYITLAKISSIEQLNQNYYLNLRTLENDKGTVFYPAAKGVHIELQQNPSSMGYC